MSTKYKVFDEGGLNALVNQTKANKNTAAENSAAVEGLTTDFEAMAGQLTEVIGEVENCLNELDETKADVTAVNNALAKKVDKVDGKGLSTNDFTTTEKNKLAGIAEGANKYTHPTYTAKNSGLYKVAIDGTGHISSATAVAKSDITALGIPAQDTVYTHPTHTAKSNGLYKVTVDAQGHVSGTTAVTKADITALGIPAQDTTYTLPAAGSSLGGVKSGGDVTISSGVITVNDDSHNHTIANVDNLQTTLDSKAKKQAGVFYIEGTGDTAGTWLGSHDDITSYYAGLMIAYKPCIAGASGLTLNINDLGAVSVVRNATSALTTHYSVNSIVFLTYTVDSDGTAYWKVSDYDSDTKTRSSNKTGSKMYIIGATTQSTSGQTTYSNKNCYIGTDNCLYSNGAKVATSAEVTAVSDLVGETAVSTQISTAIADKVDKVDGKGLSTNDYTTTEKNKLGGIATGAEVNQNAFSNITVGSTTIAADAKTDTLTLVAGSNVTLTPDATNDKITIAAKDTVYTHPTTSGNKHIPSGGSSGQILRWSADGTAVWGNDSNTTYSNATTSAAGLMSASDKSKLDGIATGANKITVDSALSSSSTNPVQNKVINSALSGKAASNHGHSDATTSAAGFLSAADKTKLDGIATGANAYTHPSYTAKSAGLYKVTVDASGHVSATSAVAKSDITALGIPSTDTTYSNATTSAAGLMSASDKSKLDGIASGANAYTLPTASSTLGGVKTTSTVTSASGYTACPIISGVPYYKDTNTTYSLSSFGITATAAELNKMDGVTATTAELNYVDGVTSNIQTQLNGKAASSHTHSIADITGLQTIIDQLTARIAELEAAVGFAENEANMK